MTQSFAENRAAAHPLWKQVESVGEQARRTVVMYALSRCVLQILAVLIVAVALDYCFRWPSGEARWIVSLAWWMAVVGFSYGSLRLIAHARWQPLDIARQIEMRFPHLRPELSTAVDFLVPREANRRVVGSAQLRSAVIDRAWSNAEHEDFSSVIDRAPFIPMQWLTIGAVLIFSLIVAFSPGFSAALQRVCFPWDDARWAQKHCLAFDNLPAAIGRGSTLNLALIDRHGKLPAEVTLQLRWLGEDRLEERRMLRVGEQMVAKLENVPRSFAVRAEGGDDYSLPWQVVEVLEPVRVVRGEWTIKPPAYLLRPPYAAGVLPVLVEGSELSWEGELEFPVSEISLDNLADGAQLRGEVRRGGTEFKIPAAGEVWQPQSSGHWQLQVVDQRGQMRLGPDVTIQILADTPPLVGWQNGGEIIAGTRSRVQLEIFVADDHAVHMVAIEVWRKDEKLWRQTVCNFERPSTVTNESLLTAIGESRPREVFTSELDLAELPPLADDTELRLIASAQDFQPGAQFIDSPPRVVRIVSADELQQRLLEEISEFQQQVATTTRLQSRARAEAEQRSKAAEGPLESVVFAQQQVADQLLRRDSGLLSNLERWLQAWKLHRLQMPAAAKAWEQVLKSGRELERQELTEVAAAIKEQNWTVVLATQEKILARLAEWSRDSAAGEEETDLLRQFIQARDDQADLSQKADELRIAWLELLTHSEDQTLREKLVDSQRQCVATQWELARRVDRIQAAVGRLPDHDQLSTAFVAAALGTRIRGAARAMDQAEWEPATRQQRECLTAMDALLKLWKPEELAQDPVEQGQLQQAAAEIDRWQAVQKASWQAWQESLQAMPNEDARAAANQEFARALRDLSQAIRKSVDHANSRALDAVKPQLASAADEFESAAAAAEKQQSRSAAVSAQRGGENLAAARTALATQMGSDEQQQLRADLEQAAEAIAVLRQTQQQLLSRTIRLQALLPTDATLSRPQLAEFKSVAAEQNVASDQAAAIQKMLPLPAFQLVLRMSETAMRSAVARLEQNQADRLTQQRQKEALLKLQLAQEQLQAALQEPDEDAAENNAAESSPNPQQVKPGQPSAAELRVVAELQRQITKRHEAAARIPENSRTEEIADLADQQRSLAELVGPWALASTGAEQQIPLPEKPGSAEVAKQMVTQELSGGEDVGQESPTFLVQLAQRLRLAAVIMEDTATHSAAIPLQQAVVRDLDRVLAQEQTRRQQSSIQRQERNSNSAGGEKIANSGEPDGDSSSDPQAQPAVKPQFDPREIERLRRTIWGHLPPQIQEQLQQAAEADFLPQYERQIREYYRRLAEERQLRP